MRGVLHNKHFRQSKSIVAFTKEPHLVLAQSLIILVPFLVFRALLSALHVWLQ
jgi:hypothetical protein